MNIKELFVYVKSMNQHSLNYLNIEIINNLESLINTFTTNSYYTHKYIEYM